MTKILLDPKRLEDKAFELIREAIGTGIHYNGFSRRRAYKCWKLKSNS